MGFWNMVFKVLDRLQTFYCANCGAEIKMVTHSINPMKGFYVVSKKSGRAYYQSLLAGILINPDNWIALDQLQKDDRIENILALDSDGTFKHFYLLCENCYLPKRVKLKKTVTCEDCGAEIPADADECPECGGPVDRILF